MDTKEITNALLREKYYSGFRVFKNIYWDSFECDILEIRKTFYTIEYEIKISRGDFKNDLKKINQFDNKIKFEYIKAGERTNYFYYVVPDGLIHPDEVPEYAGLIYAKEFRQSKYNKIISFEVIKKAPKLHKNKLSNVRYITLLEKIYYHYMQILKF